MSNPREKALLISKLRELQGMHRISVCKHRRRRTDRQNRYYWPCFVQPFAEQLQAQGEAISDDDAHEILKTRFLRKSVIDLKTGEAFEYVRSTTELNTAEFNQYLDQCAAFLADYFNLQIPEPSIYREQEETAVAA
jgi:hypothetical protein